MMSKIESFANPEEKQIVSNFLQLNILMQKIMTLKKASSSLFIKTYSSSEIDAFAEDQAKSQK